MYQGSRTFYGRYSDIQWKSVELIYDLTPKPLLFLDQGLVYPGVVLWQGRDGEAHPLHARIPYYGDTRYDKEDIVGRPYRIPTGVKFEAQPAERGPDVERLNNMGSAGASIIHQDGRYQIWVWQLLLKKLGDLAFADEKEGYDLTTVNHVVRYFESDNGVDWRAPDLDIIRVDGKKSNIITNLSLSVFIDPSSPADSRYKAFYGNSLEIPRLIRLLKERKQKPQGLSVCNPLSRNPGAFTDQDLFYKTVHKGNLPDDLSVLPAGSRAQVFSGAYSGDGMKWNTYEDPVLLFGSEEGMPYYDVEKERYAAYMRNWQHFQRRTIAVTETDDFLNWPIPRTLLSPDFDEELSTDYYTYAHSMYPDTTDVHFFFISKYFRGTNDCLDLYLAVSLDGDQYHIFNNEPIVQCEKSDWNPDSASPAACVFPGQGLVPFGSDQVGLIVTEHNIPHKWPRTVQHTKTHHWALWKKERMAALHAEDDGRFTTAALAPTHNQIFLNAETLSSGLIRCCLRNDRYEAVPDFGFAEFDTFNGDSQRHPLTWQGRTLPSNLVGKKIYLDFEMHQAKVFSLCSGT